LQDTRIFYKEAKSSNYYLKLIAMTEKELAQIKKDIIKQQKKVANSSKAAKEYLIELGVFTSKGNLKKRFKVS